MRGTNPAGVTQRVGEHEHDLVTDSDAEHRRELRADHDAIAAGP